MFDIELDTELETEYGSELADPITVERIADRLDAIGNSMDVILLLMVLSFAMGCFRSWRKNVLKGV